jgi:hypothetical protein
MSKKKEPDSSEEVEESESDSGTESSEMDTSEEESDEDEEDDDEENSGEEKKGQTESEQDISENEMDTEDEDEASDKTSGSDNSDDEDEEEDDLTDDEDNQAGQDDKDNEDVECEVVEGDEDGMIYEDSKRKKSTTRKRSKKRRIFPFLQKKKNKSVIDDRIGLEYHSFEDIREQTREYLMSMNFEEDSLIYEKAIYNATARLCKKDNLMDITIDSIEFKDRYVNILRYFIGAVNTIGIEKTIIELRTDKWGWNSELFAEAIKAEQQELNKIKNPMQATENPDNPCPRCNGKRSYKIVRQLRGGDEGLSALFWCDNKSCNHHWRVNG